MKFIKDVILGLQFGFIVMATALVCFPQETTVDQVRISALEKLQPVVANHEDRIIRLEDGIMSLKEGSQEATWWYRGIGITLALAVLERVLRTAGVIGKSDTLGPVG